MSLAALEAFSNSAPPLCHGSIARNGLGPHLHGPVRRAITTRTYNSSVVCG